MSLCAKGPPDMLDHVTSEIASGSKLGSDGTKNHPGGAFKRLWSPLIKMVSSAKAKVERIFGK